MTRRRQRATHDSRIKGHSYPQAWYEHAVGEVLTKIGRVDDWAISEVVGLHGEYRPRSDELALARIGRAREDASQKLTKTRDLVAWQSTMARLDVEEAVAREQTDGRRLSPPEIVDYLRLLPRLWAESGPAGRQAIATGSSPARTFSAASSSNTSSQLTRSTSVSMRPYRPPSNSEPRSVSLVGARGFEPPTSSSRTMRATKLRHAPTEGARLTGPTEYIAGAPARPVGTSGPVGASRPVGATGTGGRRASTTHGDRP